MIRLGNPDARAIVSHSILIISAPEGGLHENYT